MPSRALTSAPRWTKSSITSSLSLPAAIHRAETPISFLALTSAPFSRAAATAFTSPARTAAHRASRFSSRALADAATITSDAAKVKKALERWWSIMNPVEKKRLLLGRRVGQMLQGLSAVSGGLNGETLCGQGPREGLPEEFVVVHDQDLTVGGHCGPSLLSRQRRSLPPSAGVLYCAGCRRPRPWPSRGPAHGQPFPQV